MVLLYYIINNHSDFTASASGSVVTVAVSGGGTTTVTSGDTDRIAPNPVTEGEQAKFTITRTKVSGDNIAAKVYLHTSKGTAGEDDFEIIYKQALEFKKNELVYKNSSNYQNWIY